jgi:hypothetical protein
MVRCEQCGVEYTKGGRIYNNLCSFCFLFGDDCSKCPLKNVCKKEKV